MSVINFSGIASGIDSAALIDATIQSERAVRVSPSQKKVTGLEDTNSAFEQLTTKLGTLQASLKAMSSLSGGGVSKTATSGKESVMTATASNAASNGSYSMTVSTLAKNHTLSFDQRLSSPTGAVQSSLTGAEPEANRTVTFTVGTGSNQETVNVIVSGPTYSIADLVNEFNNASAKAEASLVNVGTATVPSYAMVINSNNSGTEKGTIGVTVGGSLTNLSAYSQSAATDATFSITGIGSVTRSTNTVADVVPGVTLSLVSAGTATISVSEDATTTQSKIQSFIDSYNDIVTFNVENNQISRDESGKEVKSVFGPLASTSTDEGVLSALRDAISRARAEGGAAVRIFADIGITTQRDGTLAFDTNKFQTGISNEPSSVSELLQSFADTVSLTGGTIDVFTRFNGILDITINGNKTQISDLNNRIRDAEAQIQKNAENMKLRFSRLESLIGGLQQQGNSLSSALAGLR